MNKCIIDPIPQHLIEAELTEQRFLRDTNKGNNKIYIIDAHNAPNTMREIGRLREVAFRSAGGGSGKDCDTDEFDIMDPPCRKLSVWHPDSKLI
ncbi:MAG: hemolysin, partial [Muribaculaceae bacterium]